MNKHIARGTFNLTISSFIFLLSGYVINIWLGRQLGPEDYGVYGIIITLVTIINITQTTGLPLAVSKYASQNVEKAEEVYKTGFFLQIISTLLITLIFFFFSGVIAYVLKDQSLKPYLQISSLIFPLYGMFALITGYYNGLHLFKKQAFIHIIYSVIKVFMIIAGAIFFNLYGVILGFIISPLMTLLAGFHLPKSRTNFSYKKLIFYSFPLIGIAIFSNLLQSVDIFFVKIITHSAEDPGFYTAGQNISRIPFYGLSSLSTVLLPSISRSISIKNEKETNDLVKRSLRAVLLFCTPVVLIMSATSSDLLNIIYSAKYLPATDSLSILLIGAGFFTIFTVLSNILNGAGKPVVPFCISIIGVTITTVLCMILIPVSGLNGAAIATASGSFASMVIASIFVYKKFKNLVALKSFFKIISASLIVYFIAYIINLPLLFLPFLYIFYFGIYIFFLAIMGEITKEDVAIVISLLPDWILKRYRK